MEPQRLDEKAEAGLSTDSLQSPTVTDIASTSHLPLAAKPAQHSNRFDKTFEEKKSAPKHALVSVHLFLFAPHASRPDSYVASDLSQIELRAEDLYDKDKVDIEQVEMEDVWQLLK
jgi:H+-transporting ATPase